MSERVGDGQLYHIVKFVSQGLGMAEGQAGNWQCSFIYRQKSAYYYTLGYNLVALKILPALPLAIPAEALGFLIGGAVKPSGFLQDQGFEVPQPEPGRIEDVVVVQAGQFGQRLTERVL